MGTTGAATWHVCVAHVGSQDPEEPFLRAGPFGTVRPEKDSGGKGINPGWFSARASAPKLSVLRALFRESILTVQMISMMKLHEIGSDLPQDDSQDRSAKQRGLVAHTTRPGTPESVEGEVNPLESRMKSAEM